MCFEDDDVEDEFVGEDDCGVGLRLLDVDIGGVGFLGYLES